MSFFQNTECTYHCIIMHIFEKQKQKEKQSIIKLNKQSIKVITKLPNSEQSYKGKVQTHNYINRQNQSTTGKL